MNESEKNYSHNSDDDRFVMVNKDIINEFIEENEFDIPILNDSKLVKNIRRELRNILENKETDIERENFLDEQLNKAEQKKWDNYIGCYAKIEGDRYGKDFRDFIIELENSFILKEVPNKVRHMVIFEYHHEEWEILLKAIKDGYDSLGYNFPPYQKTLKNFFVLNQRAYIVRKAYLQKHVLEEFIAEVNQGKSAIPEDYEEIWKLHKKQEKLKLNEKYNEYVKNATVEETIEKIFEQLKEKFNLKHLSDLEAANEIHSITDITFYSEDEGLTYKSVSRTIRGYKRFK